MVSDGLAGIVRRHDRVSDHGHAAALQLETWRRTVPYCGVFHAADEVLDRTDAKLPLSRPPRARARCTAGAAGMLARIGSAEPVPIAVFGLRGTGGERQHGDGI